MSVELLKLGHIITHYGKPYELVAVEPYEKKDGTSTWLYRFSGECRHPDCSARVEVTMGAFSLGKSPQGTACSAHKGWTTPERRAEWLQKLKAGRKAYRQSLTAEDKERMKKEAQARWIALPASEKAAIQLKNKQRWAGMTSEQKKAHIEKVKNALASRTPAQKAKHSAKIKEALARRRERLASK